MKTNSPFSASITGCSFMFYEFGRRIVEEELRREIENQKELFELQKNLK